MLGFVEVVELIDGVGFTTTVVLALKPLHPAFVPYTVYTPLIDVVELVRVGFCTADVYAVGPLQV